MQDLPQLSQALDFSLPTVEGEAGKMQPSISMQSNAAKIHREQEAGCEELRQLEQLLDNIHEVGCVDCYFQGDHRPHPHEHSRHPNPDSGEALRSDQSGCGSSGRASSTGGAISYVEVMRAF